MAKIHTHYDNLKVARGAPAEVIRAAYKALSQKYHPDKNPGDAKAARIMAIVNSAYNTLSDPARRREHDEWIAAEEWEIAWLESTRLEDGRADKAAPGWEEPHVEPPAPPRYRILRDPRWWSTMVLCLALGGVAGAVLMGRTQMLPVAVAGPMVTNESRASAAPPEERDIWSAPPAAQSEGAAGSSSSSSPVRTLAVTQLLVPGGAPDCDTELHSQIAPNGSAWPAQSGYIEGFPVGNQGSEMELMVDNAANGSPILVKVFDLERRSNVRHAYVLARDSITIDKLAAGKYEVRYQNIEVGGSKAQCLMRKRATLADGQR